MANIQPVSPKNLTAGFYYEMAFGFERRYNGEENIKWMSKNWTLSIWISLVYVVVIFAGQWYMKSRSKYDLRPWLTAWNGILAFFSTAAAFRLLTASLYTAYHKGFDYAVCYPPVYFGDTAIWGWLFTVSKVYELGDTVFIVLRKQKLIFLHWYHHVTVLIYTWYTYAFYLAPAQWFAAVNSLIHSFMYTYYGLRALRIKVPRNVSMSITTLQLSQMILGLYINWRTYQVRSMGEFCHTSDNNIKYSLLMYGSYFLLFAHFFYKSYVPTKKKVPVENGSCRNGIMPNGMNGVHNGTVMLNNNGTVNLNNNGTVNLNNNKKTE